jgi:hypothetical protein
MFGRDSETRRRRKDTDRDSPKAKDKDRHKSSKSSRKTTSSSKDPERDPNRERSRRASSRSLSQSHQKMSGASIPELERRSSSLTAQNAAASSSRTSLPYPSFSKAHSREAVGSRESVNQTKPSPYTPDATDIGNDPNQRSMGSEKRTSPAAPPSPPLTADESELRRSSSRNDANRSKEKEDASSSRRSNDSGSRLSAEAKESRSRSSLRESTVADGASEVTKGTEYTKAETGVETQKTAPEGLRVLSPDVRPPGRTASAGSYKNSAIMTDSDATSIAPDRKAARSKPPPLISNNEHSPLSAVDSSPRTPTSKDVRFPSMKQDGDDSSMIEIFADDGKSPSVVSAFPAAGPAGQAPPPPPPPPAPVLNAPRVDYLLQNGGLNRLVPRSMLSSIVSHNPVLTYQQYTSPRPGDNQARTVQALFLPLENVLDDYSKVIEKQGSMAVATGYRSVARRLLDRLEAVFSRNISRETCSCIICRSKQYSEPAAEGVSWGEILEYVSGRRDLPAWPPFVVARDPLGIEVIEGEQSAPMQKMDIDVPEEYREHYIRQNKKTKTAVQNWLAKMPEEPPPEMDDDTYAFAMMTQLKPDQKQLFTALHRGMSTLPGSRSVTPLEKTKPELLMKTALALQRLYRLGNPPRDPECTMFLLKYPELHGVLATLAAISNGEWEILISGRFDGFLWSGAESGLPQTIGSPVPRGPSRGPTATPLTRDPTPFSPVYGVSRGTTPFSPIRGSTISRGPTPAPSSFGAPVQMDEETEIAVLAEVEREIYIGMEVLEDAFEVLHMKAEAVRTALRERSAALAMTAQARRGSTAEDIEVRLGTPASFIPGTPFDTDTDDGIDDDRSELAPDDSASNISYGRRKRRGGRVRRTPAPVVEEDETDHSERIRDR